MERMRLLLLMCSVVTLLLVLAESIHTAVELQKSNSTVTQNRERLTYKSHRLNSKSILVSLGTAVARSKRSENADDEINLPLTRHARHRRRRRCRTRPSCFRGMTTGKQASLRKNNGKENQEGTPDADGSKSSISEDDVGDKTILALKDSSLQVLYNKTGMNYHVDASSNPLKNLDEEERIERVEGNSRVNQTDTKDVEVYDDGIVNDEIEFEHISLPSWTEAAAKERNGSTGYSDDILSPAMYAPIDDQTAFQGSMSNLLTRLFQNLRNMSFENSRNVLKGLNLVDSTDEDPCQRWLNSRDKFEEAFAGALASLPSCPCHYPSNIFYDDKIWDEKQEKYFRWRDVSGDSQRLDVYKPGAAYCVRSLVAQGSGSAAAQHCCYDSKRKLLTRGSGAGTPNFVSPEISSILHERIDVLPWRLCKGDFSRYNRVRPPNNDNACEANPDEEEYQRQIDDTKYY